MRPRLGAYAIPILLLFSAPAQATDPGGTFIDDDGNTHEGYIEAIAAEGITRGCNPPVNDRYCPSQQVSRGQMAAFLRRAFEHPFVQEDSFQDDEGHLFEDDINAIAAVEITLGCNPPTNDRFCPDDPVLRDQMASLLVRAMDITEGAGDDLFVDDEGNTHEEDIDVLGTAGVTRGCNPPTNDRFCPDDPVLRDQMASFLGRARGLQPIVPPPHPEAVLEVVADGLSQPLFVTSPSGDPRLFIVEKTGAIRIVSGGNLLSQPFLEIGQLVSDGSEQGLLGLAFHPAYADNGRFFVNYTDTDGDTRVVEYEVSGNEDRADPDSARTVLTVDQPYGNHNGGMLLFGPDGYLYIGMGDGGSGGDPHEHGQNPDTLLGGLLRIDVDGSNPYEIPPDNPFVSGGGAPEVWAFGLRNPWRFAFDDGLLYLADVGQGSWEEVNAVADSEEAVNYGWNDMEGNHCFEPPSGCATSGRERPVVEYGHDEGCSVTGGFVYRGDELPHLQGHYFYGDLCSGWVRSFRYAEGEVTDSRDWSDEFGRVGTIYSFGTDASGRLYIATGEGTVYRLAAG